MENLIIIKSIKLIDKSTMQADAPMNNANNVGDQIGMMN
jgi:hypothetical protein